MTAHQARPGDVLLDGNGTEWKKIGPEVFEWATFDGPVFHEGPWLLEYGPQGDLTLIARGGKPAGQNP